MNELMPIISLLLEMFPSAMPMLSGDGTGIISDFTEKENTGGLEVQGMINTIMTNGMNTINQLTANELNIVLIIFIIALLSNKSEATRVETILNYIQVFSSIIQES